MSHFPELGRRISAVAAPLDDPVQNFQSVSGQNQSLADKEFQMNSGGGELWFKKKGIFFAF